MFDSDASVVRFLDHCLKRFARFPGSERPVDAERYMRFPSRRLSYVSDLSEGLEIVPDTLRARGASVSRVCLPVHYRDELSVERSTRMAIQSLPLNGRSITSKRLSPFLLRFRIGLPMPSPRVERENSISPTNWRCCSPETPIWGYLMSISVGACQGRRI